MTSQSLPLLLSPNTIISSSVSHLISFLMIGVPTRFGNFPAQWKAFWDHTGSLWTKQALAGKMFGTFVSTGTPGGGQELTAFQSLSVAIHQGMVYVPIGYQIGEITNLDEVHGGSPWGGFPRNSVINC
jgi:NAD(P)H dehydrogenase (quinone)